MKKTFFFLTSYFARKASSTSALMSRSGLPIPRMLFSRDISAKKKEV